VGTGLGKLDTDSITGQIIGGAIDVQPYLAPGMPNHTYEVCLEALEASAQEAANRDVLRSLRHVRRLRVTAVDVLTPTLNRSTRMPLPRIRHLLRLNRLRHFSDDFRGGSWTSWTCRA
jgi:hypothetical protein